MALQVQMRKDDIVQRSVVQHRGGTQWAFTVLYVEAALTGIPL